MTKNIFIKISEPLHCCCFLLSPEICGVALALPIAVTVAVAVVVNVAVGFISFGATLLTPQDIP